jgi:four helix bundle protein
MYNGTVYYKSIEFALMKLELSKELKSYKEFDLASKPLRSDTSIGENVNEAGAAVSKKDLVNKMFIALKEARESWHWLRLLKESKTIEINVEQNIDRCIELIKIRTSIIKTTQSKIRK